MKQFVKLNRELNENDVGKRVRLGNGDIDEIFSFSKVNIYYLTTKKFKTYTLSGKHDIYEQDDEFDIIEIEEEVQSEDGLSMSSPLVHDNEYKNIRATNSKTNSYTIEIDDNCIGATYIIDDLIIDVTRRKNEQ